MERRIKTSLVMLAVVSVVYWANFILYPRHIECPMTPPGDAVILAKTGSSEIVVTMSRDLGTFRSLAWNGRYKLGQEQAVKWNCLLRAKDAKTVPGVDSVINCVVVMSNATGCETTLAAIDKKFPK